MKVKSYYARSVEEAVGTASSEMGPDAMLVHSRKSPMEMRHLGPYEVVFALPPNGTHRTTERSRRGPDSTESAERAPSSSNDGGSIASLSLELMQMRRQMEEIRRTLAARNSAPATSVESAPLLERAQSLLLAADLDADLAASVAEIAVAEFSPREKDTEDGAKPEIDLDAMRKALRAELSRRLVPSVELRMRGDSASVVALIGPPGSGKTTTLVKLATMIGGGAAERPAHLISADTLRIGAAEQLRTYAAILGISIDMTDTPAAIRQSIESNRHKELILIDTPGLSGTDLTLLDDLADFLAGRSDIEKHLVLPATMRSRDLKRCLRTYDRFSPDRLLFTHLDETDAFGALCSTAVAAGIPMSYFSAGQQVPEDLEPASCDKLLDTLLGTGGTTSHE